MTRQKHHFAPWKDLAPENNKEQNTVYSHCTACKIVVKQGPVGGVKFYVRGKWVSKRPSCSST